MIEDKKTRHRNKPNRMSDAEIMVILILFHSSGFRCFKHYYKEYVCKHLKHLFPRQVSYNRFVELEKEVLLPLTIFIKKVHNSIRASRSADRFRSGRRTGYTCLTMADPSGQNRPQ